MNKTIKITTIFALVLGFIIPISQAQAHGLDSLVKDSNGTVYFVSASPERTEKRPFTSLASLQSYGFLNLDKVVAMDSEDSNHPVGKFIPPRDGTVFCATETKGTDIKGECSLITDGKKAAFTSEWILDGQGFSFTKALYGDSSFLEKTANISNRFAAHNAGVLVNENGSIYLMAGTFKLGVPNIEIFNSWGWSFVDVIPANISDKKLPELGIVDKRLPGELDILQTEIEFSEEAIDYATLILLLEDYEEYPTKLATNQSNWTEVRDSFTKVAELSFKDSYPYLTDYSKQVLTELPVVLDDLVEADDEPSNNQLNNISIELYGNGNYAVLNADFVDLDTNKSEPLKLFFLKENGKWKIDLIAILKWVYSEAPNQEDPVTIVRPSLLK